ncbi:uncharacterized protein LOC129324318 isoform X2 [Eublepharis macularius]|uniref:Uncharacterized protein LOC129324318 isoform X2 n=1 Tax=Eublepharis macularius TaxID=481883 RepID=A0AA97IXK8_EUBMA|nr:uncharacterized protein LOC129324318 isoform X2 [Eublepharis macularius]
MEMARKREHFGLSYLEELTILKERENICKESRLEFLKFKQTANAQTNLNKPVCEVTPPDQAHQLVPYSLQSSQRPPLLLENTNLPVDWDTSKSLKRVDLSPDVTVMGHQTQRLETKQKKSHKKEDTMIDNHLAEDEKGPVAIASLIGTTKKVSMLKKPEPPPKPRSRKLVHAKSVFEKPLSPQQVVHDTEQPAQKMYSQHKIMANVGTSSDITEMECSSIMDSSSSEKLIKMSKEISKPSILKTLIELEEPYSKKISKVSNAKSISGSLQEARDMRRSKLSEKFSPKSRSQIQDSIQKFPSGVLPRSIDEIIASLQSTAPTPSDLRIKELLESVLGQDYNIKIESPVDVPVKPETKEEISIYSSQPQVTEREIQLSILEMPSKEAVSVKMEQLKMEPWVEELGSPAKRATLADSEQTQLDTSQRSRLESMSLPTEQEYIEVEEDTPKAKDQNSKQTGAEHSDMDEEHFPAGGTSLVWLLA